MAVTLVRRIHPRAVAESLLAVRQVVLVEVRQVALVVARPVANRSAVVQQAATPSVEVQQAANRSAVVQQAATPSVEVQQAATPSVEVQPPVVQQVVSRQWMLARARLPPGIEMPTMTASALRRASHRRSKAASRFLAP